LQIWFKPPLHREKQGGLIGYWKYEKVTILKTLFLKSRTRKKTPESQTHQGSVLALGEKYILGSGIPLIGFDPSKMKLTNKDRPL
jgi:hypothetical protein